MPLAAGAAARALLRSDGHRAAALVLIAGLERARLVLAQSSRGLPPALHGRHVRPARYRPQSAHRRRLLDRADGGGHAGIDRPSRTHPTDHRRPFHRRCNGLCMAATAPRARARRLALSATWTHADGYSAACSNATRAARARAGWTLSTCERIDAICARVDRNARSGDARARSPGADGRARHAILMRRIDAILRHDARQSARAVRCPTLVIAAQDDAVTRPIFRERSLRWCRMRASRCCRPVGISSRRQTRPATTPTADFLRRTRWSASPRG